MACAAPPHILRPLQQPAPTRLKKNRLLPRPFIFLSCPALKQKLLPKAPLLNTKIYQDLKNHSQSTASTTGHFWYVGPLFSAPLICVSKWSHVAIPDEEITFLLSSLLAGQFGLIKATPDQIHFGGPSWCGKNPTVKTVNIISFFVCKCVIGVK